MTYTIPYPEPDLMRGVIVGGIFGLPEIRSIEEFNMRIWSVAWALWSNYCAAEEALDGRAHDPRFSRGPLLGEIEQTFVNDVLNFGDRTNRRYSPRMVLAFEQLVMNVQRRLDLVAARSAKEVAKRARAMAIAAAKESGRAAKARAHAGKVQRDRDLVGASLAANPLRRAARPTTFH